MDIYPWDYGRPGLSQDGFQPLLELLRQVMPCLDHRVIVSKATLDETLADWMLPMIPADKGACGTSRPCMEVLTDRPWEGGCLPFFSRPCAFCRLVVFGKRDGISPIYLL